MTLLVLRAAVTHMVGANRGNKTRIDYGTGHETAFVALLCCLWRIGYFTQEDFKALVLRVFATYVVVRVALTHSLTRSLTPNAR